MKETENNLEIEYKFWAGELTKEQFHDRFEAATSARTSPFYVVSCDDYYTRNSNEDFVRYRKGGGRTELTLKFKRKQNTVRKEINLDISSNDDISIVEFLKLSGYEKAFSVFKEAWIYHEDDCDISYYTLSDGRSVVEVEAVGAHTVTEGVSSIDAWSDRLGLVDLERETRSLFEIFTDESSEITN
jgi:adenylate cyclase class IV